MPHGAKPSRIEKVQLVNLGGIKQAIMVIDTERMPPPPPPTWEEVVTSLNTYKPPGVCDDGTGNQRMLIPHEG